MSNFKGLLKRFQRDQRGNVAMMFGFAAIPMIAAAGTAIDYGRLSASQSKIHAALDAAVLAVARDPSISVDPATAAGQLTRSKIQGFFAANLYDQNLLQTPSVVLKPTTGDKVLVEVTGCVKMAFVNFTGVLDPCVKASSEVTRGGSVKMEVALAMDNSGSMSAGKMDEAKLAAQDFVQKLLSAAVTPDHVKISVVPFTNTVNTGLARTSPGMDTNGLSPIHWENLTITNTKPAGIASRFTLFDQLNQTWGGCVETRPGAYGTNDDAPSNAVPSSLFVPFFYPDEPGDKSNGSENFVYSGTLNERNNAGNATYIRHNSYLNDDGGSSNTHDGNGRENATSNSACGGGVTPFTLPYNNSVSNWQSRNWLARSVNNVCRYNLSGTSGGNITSRHTIGQNSNLTTVTGFAATVVNYKMGPNMSCHSAPIARLTNNQATLTTAINNMVNYGGTNILDGFMWAWRTVSPNAPFSDGRSYTWTDPLYKNRKIIVIMTDGDNQWNASSNPNGSAYSVNGFYRNNRLSTGVTTAAQAKTALDDKTLEACTNAKAKKNSNNDEAITIYTVGFSTTNAPISAGGETLLQNCASIVGGQRLYYKATTAAELKTVFAGIAAELAKMKLTK
jgi:Flp pilus assembly protein TadG